MKGNGVGEIIDLNKVMREQELLKANEERIAAFNLKQEYKLNAIKSDNEFGYEELKDRNDLIKTLKQSGVR